MKQGGMDQAGRVKQRAKVKERGVQMVELAFVMPVLMMILGAMAEFGFYFQLRSTLTRATNTGARLMTMTPTIDATAQTRIKNITACGVADCTAPEAVPVVKNLTPNNIQIGFNNITQNGLVTGRTVTVSIVNYSYTPIFFSPKRFFGGNQSNTDQVVPNSVTAQTTMRHLIGY